MLAPLYAICAVFGLLIGSFLNVVVWRVPRGESIVAPPSHCPSCDALIAPRDNLPVLSWLVLRGRCRRCGSRISVRYPLVEAGTAGLFVLMVWRFGATPQLPGYLYLMAVGLALALIDVDVKRLPNALTLPSYPVGLAALGAAAWAEGTPDRYIRSLIGMGALFGFYLLLVLVYPAGMGLGDVKLSGVLGLYLGWVSYGALAVGAFLAFLVGGVAGIAVMAVGGGGRKTRIPFGPFMLVGALLGVLVGQSIASGYADLTFR